MKDIFDAKIICENCNKEMKPAIVGKQGVHLRAVRCEKCGEEIIHPVDLEKFNHYKDMKGKIYNVKLRVVGNSHAISIPKEILDFVNDMQSDMKRQMDDMVRLCFEDFGKLSVNFFEPVQRRHIESFEKPSENFQNSLRRTQRTSSLIHSTFDKLKSLKERKNESYSKSSIEKIRERDR